jgi:anti-anti-sigma factor
VDAARIETRRSDLDEVVVAVCGEIDLVLRARLVNSIRAAAALPGVKTVVVDFTHTSFMDASGIGALVIGRQAARTVGVGYRVIGVAGQVRQVLEMANMVDALVDPAWPDCDGETRLKGDQKSAAVGRESCSDLLRARRDSNS